MIYSVRTAVRAVQAVSHSYCTNSPVRASSIDSTNAVSGGLPRPRLGATADLLSCEMFTGVLQQCQRLQNLVGFA